MGYIFSFIEDTLLHVGTLLPRMKFHHSELLLKNINSRGIWLAQSVEHATLGIKVLSWSPTLDVEIT